MTFSVASVKKQPQVRRYRTRVYVWIKDLNLQQYFVARQEGFASPHETYRKEVLKDAFLQSGIASDAEDAQSLANAIEWSEYAGCRTCPCSPGFILSRSLGFDLHIEAKLDEQQVA